VGELTLTCDATQVNAPGGAVTVQFVLATNTIVTNSTDTSTPPVTMAGAAVQYATAPQDILHTVQGIVWSTFGNTNNAYRFPHVVLPTGTTFQVRFFNVRVSALALSNVFGGTQILGLLAINTENPSGWTVSITNQQPAGILMATVQPTLKFAVTDCTGKATTANIAFQECIDYTLSSDFPGSLITPVYGVTFTEQQQTAFKNIVEEDGATIGPGTQVPTGPQICDTAHDGIGDDAVIDDTPPVPDCTPEAWVSNGTRLLAQFAVPSQLVGKVHIWVSQFQTASPTGTSAILATITSANGWGLDDYDTGDIVNCSSPGGVKGNEWVMLPDGATETAAWEIIDDTLADFDSITFAWAITYSENNLPSLPAGQTFAPIQLGGTIAPISTQAVPAPVTLSKQPVVRFNLPLQNSPVQITIQHCVTNLLFPYVTNLVGFNVGIAISNTSLDTAWNLSPVPATVDPNFGTAKKPMPYNTTPQNGPCNLYLFGSSKPQNMAGAGTAVQAIASATTPSVLAGQTFADTMTNIFALNAGSSPITMSGYVIARCQFQFGHGYAYLTSPNGLPQGYLALIIPDRAVLNAETGTTGIFNLTPIRIAQPFSNAIFDEQGEVLSQ